MNQGEVEEVMKKGNMLTWTAADMGSMSFGEQIRSPSPHDLLFVMILGICKDVSGGTVKGCTPPYPR